MLKPINLFIFLCFSLCYVNQSNACEWIVNDFINEIKVCEGESKIKESNGGYYIDPSLLSLQEDGIHLVFGDQDILVPFMYHDTKGYFLSLQACVNLGDKWMCCKCNHQNDVLLKRCEVCLNKRCAKLKSL